MGILLGALKIIFQKRQYSGWSACMLAESVEAANLKSNFLMLKPFSSAQELLHKYDLDVFFDVVRAIKEAGMPRQCLATWVRVFPKILCLSAVP